MAFFFPFISNQSRKKGLKKRRFKDRKERLKMWDLEKGKEKEFNQMFVPSERAIASFPFPRF